MKKHKASGKVAQFETRDEAAKKALAQGTEHEVVRKGDTYKRDGADTLHKDDAVTAGDVRIVALNDDGSYAHVGPWNKASEKEAMQKDWDEAN